MAEADQAVELDEPLEFMSEEDMGVLRRLYVESSNLLCLLSEDTSANITWGCERAEIEATLAEAKKVLW